VWNGRDKGELEVGDIFPCTCGCFLPNPMLMPFPTEPFQGRFRL